MSKPYPPGREGPEQGGSPFRAIPARFDYPLLALGVVAVSFSAIFIRQAEAPALSMAFYRNLFATALVLPIALARYRAELRSLDRRQVLLAIGSGALLAAHFAAWIPSLAYTTVAASVVLVTTQPVWTALAARVFLGERMRPAVLAGIGVALGGAAVISGGDLAVSGRAAFGDALALIGAVTAAGYFLLGRSLRQRLSLVPYVTIAYGACAAFLLPVALVSGSELGGFSGHTWALLVLMAVVPSILGHTVFNYLLRHLDPTLIAIAIMGEPVGSALLALGFFGEVPPWTAVAGGILILIGIHVAVTNQARKQLPSPVE
ncbi:MAG: DMT family transporter [Actinobacteria bacterium]|nr:DMT family transporter [Actinomycetota bacterium]